MMNKEIILTPGELYYLGKLLQAKYIDYSYIAAMEDINKDYSLFEKETQAALVNSGALIEDFSGNIEISSVITDVVNPVFFGEFESSIHDCVLGEEKSFNVIKFHFYDDRITMVTHANGKFVLKNIDLLEIDEIIKNLLPEQCDYENDIPEDLFIDKISRLYVFKNATVTKKANTVRFLQQDGKIFRETIDQGFLSVSKEVFELVAYNIIKGA